MHVGKFPFASAPLLDGHLSNSLAIRAIVIISIGPGGKRAILDLLPRSPAILTFPAPFIPDFFVMLAFCEPLRKFTFGVCQGPFLGFSGHR